MMNIIHKLVAWYNTTIAELGYDEMVFIELNRLS